MQAMIAATAGNAIRKARGVSVNLVRINRMDEMKSSHRKANRMIFTTRVTKTE
ncbi:MAG: hypothetical protein ABR899_08810 [Candidatus Krumholzibacteriaceae bacterium]|jgi:hypothetical protein